MNYNLLILVFVLFGGALYPSPPTKEVKADPPVIEIEARRFEFSPARVEVCAGNPVTLRITAQDTDHGFEIPSLKIKTRLEKGKSSDITINPKENGEFFFKCSVYCGKGHKRMRGVMIVKECPDNKQNENHGGNP